MTGEENSSRDKRISRVNRREFLGISTGMAVGGVVAAGVVGGIAGYLAGQAAAPPAAAVTVTRTAERTVTLPRAPEVKVGYIYVGPVGDYGWTYAHDQGRKWADARLPGTKSAYIESVPDPQAASAMETLITREDAKLIFTTSFGYMDPTAEMAAKYPDRYFVHISGYRSGAAGNAPRNMSSAFAEFYQLYYLNGLAAGAVTRTGIVGYVAAHPIPEVVRHINAFVLGANYAYRRRTGRNIKAYVVWLFSWFDPAKARTASISLIEEKNADVLAYTEDTPATLQVAEEYTTQKGRRVWSFSHYSDMRQYGPNSHLTGQIVNWGPIYLEFYRMVATNTWESVDIWTRIGDYMPWRWRLPDEKSTAGKAEGTVYLAPLNPAIPAEWQREIKLRYEQMKELVFEPFSPEGNLGQPIRDQAGEVMISDKEYVVSKRTRERRLGSRADRDALWEMDWFVEYIESELPR
ncbi:MAG: BMP family ABC transporter substrate-binding protein [Thaumarchaeota archaeon]|nr:BMP family ABC transporter substrate-binding protein [Candidatus Calditenuaceae archaeon]